MADGGFDLSTIGPGNIGSTAGPLNILATGSNTTGGIASLLSSNPNLLGGLAGAAGGIAGLLMGGGDSVPYSGQLTGIAGQAGAYAGNLSADATTLINPLITGNLPTGAQAEVQSVLDKQNAATKARYAALGQTGSTMETDALNQNKQQSVSQTFQIAQNMAQTGLQAQQASLSSLGLESGIYGNLMKAQTDQDASFGKTIGSFASAIGGALAFL